jgi:hypothetical protein
VLDDEGHEEEGHCYSDGGQHQSWGQGRAGEQHEDGQAQGADQAVEPHLRDRERRRHGGVCPKPVHPPQIGTDVAR